MEIEQIAQGGDRDAYEQLVNKSNGAVRRLVYRYFFAEPEVAEDIVAETYRIGFEKITDTDKTTKFYFTSWFLRIAFNLVQDTFRERGRKPTDSLEEKIEFSPRTAGTLLAPELDPAVKYEREEWLRTLGAVEDIVMAELPEAQAKAIRLAAEDLSYSEIGEQMGVSSRKVKSLLERGRKTARQLFLTVAAELDLDIEGRL